MTVSPTSNNNVANGSAATTTGAASQSLDQNFDSFLKLLTTQLANQDPLSPLDPTQFTSQLAQFSQVEQAINTNTKLQQLLDSQTASVNSAAVSYLGKTIEAQGATSTLANGTTGWTYTLPSDATSVTIGIENSNGQVVRVLQGPTQKGEHQVSWDGTDSAGNASPNGAYTIKIAATDASGNAITASTTSTGTVAGVSFANGKTELQMDNGQSVAITDVTAMRDPTATASTN